MMMRRTITILLVIFAVLVFATWQYRLLCLLLAVIVNRQWIRKRWRRAYPAIVGGLAVAIFIAVPNYFQRGRTQLVYLDHQGERICTPLPVYLVNAVLPEEELMNAALKASAVLPPALLSPLFKNLGSRFIRDAKHDFWGGKALSFYMPYNRLSVQGSNPGSFVIAQTMNEMLGTDYEGIYVTKPRHYDSSKSYPVVFFAHGFLGSWELYHGLLSRLEDCLVVGIGTRDLSGVFSYESIKRIFTKYLPYLESSGFHVDKNSLHLMGLSNGGTAADVGLRHFSSQFKTISYISTSCNVAKSSRAKVIMIGGGKDNSAMGLPSAAQRLRKQGTKVALLFDREANHYMMLYEAEQVFEFLNREMF